MTDGRAVDAKARFVLFWNYLIVPHDVPVPF